MATVHVKFLTGLKETVKKESADVSVAEGSTVEDLLNRLCDQFGESLRVLIFKKGAPVAGNLIIFVNGRNIITMSGFKTELKDGDQVILPLPVAGG